MGCEAEIGLGHHRVHMYVRVTFFSWYGHASRTISNLHQTVIKLVTFKLEYEM